MVFRQEAAKNEAVESKGSQHLENCIKSVKELELLF